MHNQVRVVTYNCKNVKSSISEIRELCEENDIILFAGDLATKLNVLSEISANFTAKGISSMCITDGVITGRPYGGLAILWSKHLQNVCNPVISE